MLRRPIEATANQAFERGRRSSNRVRATLHNDSFNLSTGLRFWERLKHLVCGYCIFFFHEQLIINAVIPDCCENVCGQKRTLPISVQSYRSDDILHGSFFADSVCQPRAEPQQAVQLVAVSQRTRES